LALDLAMRFGRSVYDSMYLAVAVLRHCPVVTADRRLHDALADGPSALICSGSPTFPDPAYTACMLDPVTISVLTHRFAAIVEEMGEAMLRTAYSQILNFSRDFSTAICDGQARLVAQA